nr:hypothetical protein [Fluviibacterium aquatile]
MVVVYFSSTVSHVVKIRKLTNFLKPWSVGQGLVPKAGMMGASIANLVEACHPGNERSLLQSRIYARADQGHILGGTVALSVCPEH